MTTSSMYPRVSLGQLELSGRVPASVPSGHLIECEWELANRASDAIAVSFYLRVAPSRLAAFVCPNGQVRHGRRHGSAALLIPVGGAVTLSASLQPVAAGDYPVCVAVVTRYETRERTDIVTVQQDRGQNASRLDRRSLWGHGH